LDWRLEFPGGWSLVILADITMPRSLPVADEYSAQWAAFRRINRTAILWLAVGFPALVPLAILVKIFVPAIAPISYLILAGLWIFGFAIFGFRFAGFRCPRCNNKFFAHQGLDLGTPRRCARCGLNLYEST
jgi:hypothetical protein